MHIKFWGVRGSLAMPLAPQDVEDKVRRSIELFVQKHRADLTELPAFLEQNQLLTSSYGGHTSCVEITGADSRLVIDAGSGIKALGDQLIQGELGSGKGHLKLLMTHFHWDHLIGLPFFAPLYIPGNKIEVYSPDPYVEEAFKMIFKKPFFPLPFEQLAADISFHHLPPRTKTNLGEFEISPYRLDHPDPCWGYKITSAGRTLSYAVDTEAHRQSPAELGEDLPLFQDSDLLVFDAQYTLSELSEKRNWGHSAAPIGLRLAMEHGISQVTFVHHDPGALDENIEQAHREAQSAYEELKKAHPQSQLTWRFVREGERVKV